MKRQLALAYVNRHKNYACENTRKDERPQIQSYGPQVDRYLSCTECLDRNPFGGTKPKRSLLGCSWPVVAKLCDRNFGFCINKQPSISNFILYIK